MDFTAYELRNLTAHLVAARRYSDLHRLLAWETGASGENMWYQARATAGEVDGFLGDVRRGWDAATAGRGAGAVECLALQVRYALTTATMGSLAGAVPPALMVELVQTGVWTMQDAVQTARRVPQPEQRVEALMRVATVPGLTQQETDRVQQESLAAVQAITDPYLRAGVSARLSITLPEDLQERIYSTPLPSPEEIEVVYATGDAAADRAEQERSEARVVRGLLDELAEGRPETLDHALDVALTLTGELQRTLAVAQVAPRLVEQGRRADAEAAVASLTSTDRTAQGTQRLRDARASIPSPGADSAWGANRWQAELLAGEIRERADPASAARAALKVSERVGDAALVDVLIARGVGVLLDTGSLDEAVSETETLRSQRWLVPVLRRLAAVVTPATSPRVELLVTRIEDVTEWAEVLLALPSETAADTDRRRDLVHQRRQEGTRDPASRAELAALLGAHSPQPHRTALVIEATRLLDEVIDPNARARTMARVLRHTPEAVGLMSLPVDDVHPTHDALVREAAATALVALGKPDEAVEALSGIADGAWRHCATYSLATLLASRGHSTHAWDLAVLLPEPFVTRPLVERLMVNPVPDVLRAVWKLIDALSDPARRATVLADAGMTGAACPDRARAVSALKVALAGCDDRRILPPLLAAARTGVPIGELRECLNTLKSDSLRSVATASLSLCDGSDEPLRTLDSLPATDSLLADIELATLVDGPQLVTVLTHAADMLPAVAGDLDLHSRVVAAVRPGLALSDTTMTNLWTNSLDLAARHQRPDALETLQSMQGLALAMAGTGLVIAVGAAARQVARWWP